MEFYLKIPTFTILHLHVQVYFNAYNENSFKFKISFWYHDGVWIYMNSVLKHFPGLHTKTAKVDKTKVNLSKKKKKKEKKYRKKRKRKREKKNYVGDPFQTFTIRFEGKQNL